VKYEERMEQQLEGDRAGIDILCVCVCGCGLKRDWKSQATCSVMGRMSRAWENCVTRDENEKRCVLLVPSCGVLCTMSQRRKPVFPLAFFSSREGYR
jgi:hypothetical protein